MEQKTDLSGEFGLLSDQARKEFEFNHSPELIGPTNEIVPPTDPGLQDNEFTPNSVSTHSVQGAEKRKKHRRTLLLQMAAVGLGVVVVTSSFGIDLLGSDALFPSLTPVDPIQPTPQSGVLYLTIPGEEAPVYLFRDGQTTDHNISGLSYDPELNTLTLSNCNAGALYAHNMGEDFSFYLRGENKLDHILVDGDSEYTNSLTVDGDLQSQLTVNQEQTHPIGLWVNAGDSAGILSVDWSIRMDLYGSEAALVVSNDGAEGIKTYPVTLLSGDPIQGQFATSSYTDWSVSDHIDSQTPGTHVHFDATFKLDTDVIDSIYQKIMLYENAPYGNPFIDTYTTNGCNLISPDTPITITNTANSTPIYIYYRQFTRHDEPFPVEWVQDEMDWESSGSIPTVDLQGEYYSGGGIAYLATDGESLHWDWDAVINADTFPSTAVTLEPGESVTFTLPDDGTDSIYRLFAETYFPELDYYYYLYTTFRF